MSVLPIIPPPPSSSRFGSFSYPFLFFCVSMMIFLAGKAGAAEKSYTDGIVDQMTKMGGSFKEGSSAAGGSAQDNLLEKQL